MKLLPLPGYMTVRLEALYKSSNLIHIPERYRKAPHLVGRIVSISMRPEDQRTLGVDLIPGNRIIVSPLGGRHISEDTWVYPITLIRKDMRGKKYRDSGVLAIIPDSIDLTAHSQSIERCAYCGDVNNSKQNMIMVDGVCPRCGKNKQGVIPDNSVKLTDREIARCTQIAK